MEIPLVASLLANFFVSSGSPLVQSIQMLPELNYGDSSSTTAVTSAEVGRQLIIKPACDSSQRAQA